jgi:hypothetical protein
MTAGGTIMKNGGNVFHHTQRERASLQMLQVIAGLTAFLL